MYFLLICLAQLTADAQWQPAQKTLNQYLALCKEDRTNQLKWAKGSIRDLKAEMRDIKRARIVPGSEGTYRDGGSGRYISFSSKSGKTDALVRAQQMLDQEEKMIQHLRDRTKPHYAYTQFKRAPNDYNNTATPFEVGQIYHHYSVHRVIKVLEDGCLVLMNWDVRLGGGEVEPHTTHVLIRRRSTKGLVDGGPIPFTEPLYVATTEVVMGRTYPVLVPVLEESLLVEQSSK